MPLRKHFLRTNKKLRKSNNEYNIYINRFEKLKSSNSKENVANFKILLKEIIENKKISLDRKPTNKYY